MTACHHRHPRPGKDRHPAVTDPTHVARVAVMRRDFRTQRAQRAEPVEAVHVRDLDADDEILGIDLGQQPPAGLLEAASSRGTPSQIE